MRLYYRLIFFLFSFLLFPSALFAQASSPSSPDASVQISSADASAAEQPSSASSSPSNETPSSAKPDIAATKPGPSDTSSKPVESASEKQPPSSTDSSLKIPKECASSDFGVSTAGRVIYFFEGVKIRGNTSTSDEVIKQFIPFEKGDPFDVNDPSVERIRWRLLGTGWFNDVRLSLEKGLKRGWIVLVIEVEERNTLIINRVVAGISQEVKQHMKNEKERYSLEPYAGIGVAETNLFGLGIETAISGVYSPSQGGADLLYSDPTRLGAGFNLDGHFFYVHGREFFGGYDSTTAVDKSESCDNSDTKEECQQDREANAAVVRYDRFSFSLGTGHDITSTLRYSIGWQGEIVNVTSMPEAASMSRGSEPGFIDFHIEDGESFVSTLYFALIFDRRDDPPFPSRGQLIRLDARIGASWIGSSYDFSRFEGSFRHWQPLPWGHVLSIGLYLGAIYKDAPFFYRFYVADLCDLIPKRTLELNLDHRGPPNFFGTSIEVMRREELAGKIDLEYNMPLHRGGGGLRGLDAYARVGLYSLASWDDLRYAIRGYNGLSRIPIDFTFDVGVRADTSMGIFTFGFSTILGFLPNPW
jgi:outer membrane protein insertion porin family